MSGSPESTTTPASTLARPLGAIAREDMSLDDAAMFLLRHGVSSALVVRGRDQLSGVVSMTDLVRHRFIEGETHEARRAHRAAGPGHTGHAGGERRATVRDVMTPFVLSLPAGASIAHAAAVMSAHHADQIVLLSHGNRGIGVVHAAHVLRWFARRDGVALPDDLQSALRETCTNAL